MPLFKELAGSPVETYDPEGMTAQRRLLCAYEDRHAVLVALLGDGYEFGGHAQSPYPGRSGVLAMRVRVEPFEKRPDDQGQFDDLTADLNRYSGQFVEVAVDYELVAAESGDPLPPKPPPGTTMTYAMDFGGEYLALPSHALRWQSDATTPVPPGAVPTLRIPISEHHVTWHRVVNPPWEAIRASLGAVNAGEFLGTAPETLLFDGAKADRVFAGLDELRQPQYAWRILYVFREKTIKAMRGLEAEAVYGWNHAYRAVPPESGWDKPVDEAGNTLYRAVDFAPLFAFGTA
jgi:hypothetical protein